MEFLMVADKSARAAQLEQFLRGLGHLPACVQADRPLRPARDCWSGMIAFADQDASFLGRIDALDAAARWLSVPLIVVADPGVKIDAPCGVVVLPGSTDDAAILKELSERCRVTPLPEPLRTQLAAPVIKAVEQTLREMAGVDVVVLSSYQRSGSGFLGDINVSLTLTESAHGALALEFGTNAADGLARRILPDSDPNDRTMLADCMGEIANVVAGQAKALLAGTPHHFHFSTPKINVGRHENSAMDSATSMVIAFDSDVGPLAVQICG